MLSRIDDYLVKETMILSAMLQARNIRYTTIIICAGLFACILATLGTALIVRNQPQALWPLMIAFGILDVLSGYMFIRVFNDGMKWDDYRFFKYVLFANGMRKNVKALRIGLILVVLLFFVPLNLMGGMLSDRGFIPGFLYGMSQTAVTIVPVIIMLYLFCAMPVTDPANAMRILKKFTRRDGDNDNN